MTFTFVAFRKVGVFGNTVKLGFISCTVKKLNRNFLSHVPACHSPQTALLDITTKANQGICQL